MSNKNVALLTSRYWEGAYTFKKFLEHRTLCDNILVQKTWWREDNSFSYSTRYLELREEDLGSENRRYFTIEELAKPAGVKIHYIESINSEASIGLLDKLAPALITLVGSPIIKRQVIKRFPRRIVNYHTGMLPYYRGPYSEFWAIYNCEQEMIGTTIHLIDRGIDTGDILASEKVSIQTLDPQEAHIINAMKGATLMARTINMYLNGLLVPKKQDESKARYYPFPTEEHIQSYETRIGKKIELYYAD